MALEVVGLSWLTCLCNWVNIGVSGVAQRMYSNYKGITFLIFPEKVYTRMRRGEESSTEHGVDICSQLGFDSSRAESV